MVQSLQTNKKKVQTFKHTHCNLTEVHATVYLDLVLHVPAETEMLDRL